MSRARIMVVEDEVLVCKDISNRLTSLGYEVAACVGRGADAIEAARRENPDLILMDINLRDEIDGIEAAQAIHQAQDLPIIFCTAYSNDEILERAKITTPYGYILKPFDNRELEINIEIALYKHAAERSLQETEWRLNTTLSNISEGVIGTDTEGRVILINPVAEALTGTRMSDVRGMSIWQLLELHDFDTHGRGVNLKTTVLRKGRSLKRLRQYLITRNGDETPVELNARPIPGDDRYREAVGMVISLRDIRQQLGYETQIRRNAFYDPLTGLPNRTLFLDRVDNAISRAREHTEDGFAVLFLDIDQFRSVNEGLGHGAGDALIVEVSRRVSEVLGKADTLSRFGGDIFAALLENRESLADVVDTVGNIKRQFAQGFAVDDRLIDTSCCIGIVMNHPHYISAEDMVRDADTAVHRAKAEGRGSHTVFDRGMHTAALRALEWRDEMQRGIEEQRFSLEYQPIVDVNSGKLSGLEALLRWRSDKYGHVSPDDFVPVAEASGLILPLGRWVLETVCQQIVQWRDQFDLDLHVDVNLSGVQFDQSNLAMEIRQLLSSKGLAPEQLGLEITESVAMRDIEFSIDTMTQLQALGIKISIDDFGTGYSSLAYLKRFPISLLKIDRSFVTNITNDRNDQAIASAIIALAKQLDLRVLAEGVETREQRDHLIEQGCDFIQGYFYSEPLSSDEVVPELVKIGLLELPSSVLTTKPHSDGSAQRLSS
ncbi:MAG: EAL domain-containing protein [Pseudomonadota bacterium]